MPEEEWVDCPNPKCDKGKIYGSGMAMALFAGSKQATNCPTCQGSGKIKKS